MYVLHIIRTHEVIRVTGTCAEDFLFFRLPETALIFHFKVAGYRKYYWYGLKPRVNTCGDRAEERGRIVYESHDILRSICNATF